MPPRSGGVRSIGWSGEHSPGPQYDEAGCIPVAQARGKGSGTAKNPLALGVGNDRSELARARVTFWAPARRADLGRAGPLGRQAGLAVAGQLERTLAPRPPANYRRSTGRARGISLSRTILPRPGHPPHSPAFALVGGCNFAEHWVPAYGPIGARRGDLRRASSPTHARDWRLQDIRF